MGRLSHRAKQMAPLENKADPEGNTQGAISVPGSPCFQSASYLPSIALLRAPSHLPPRTLPRCSLAISARHPS